MNYHLLLYTAATVAVIVYPCSALSKLRKTTKLPDGRTFPRSSSHWAKLSTTGTPRPASPKDTHANPRLKTTYRWRDEPPLSPDSLMNSRSVNNPSLWSMKQHQHQNQHEVTSRHPQFDPKPTAPFSQDDTTVASVVRTVKGDFKIVPDSWDPKALAYGMLARTVNSTGWDVLNLVTDANQSTGNDTASMYSAGLLEGYLTADRIALMYTNTMATWFPLGHSQQVLLPRVREFLTRQFAWARDFAAASASSSPVARHTGYVLAQLQGLIDGYMASNVTSAVKDPLVLHLLNANADLADIVIALENLNDDYFDRMSDKEFKNFFEAAGHCSALIRVTPGLEQVFVGHSTWTGYSSMLRMYKHYHFDLVDPDTASRGVSFSSYPGYIQSFDDFYILDSGMVVMETTNLVFNLSLFKSVKPESLLSWQRTRVANQIARNGSHWAWAVAQQNSGTYNNQYMIIDLHRIKLNQSIDDGALTIVEQIPTLVVSSDQTAILRTGYFPSYNVPFHEKIYNMSGYPDVVKKRGLDFSYQMAPRAKVFRREAPKVMDSESMASVLRFNRYTDDPYSEGDPCNSICCRKDLRPAGRDSAPRGCLDSKFTNLDMARYLTSYAISGPTTGSVDHKLPPFSWKQFPNVSHVGLPPAYNFDWMIMSPTVI